ncbi:MAG: sensor histidine kinase [Anaerolineae bacterium]|nr:sensor histidine kinase [Anaerolineae bacterium]
MGDATDEAAGKRYKLTVSDLIFRALAVLAFIEIGALVLDIAMHPNAPGIVGLGLGLRIFMGLVTGPLTILLSALLLWRVPGNRVARFLLLLGILQVGSQFSFEWGDATLSGLALALLILFAGGIAAPSIGYLMLNFPTGQIYPPQWLRVVLVLAIVKFLGVVLELVASPRDIRIFSLPINPLFVPALAPIQPWIAPTIGVTGLLLPVILIVGMLSLVLRYRASAAREQQQIKWVVWAFGAILPVVLVAFSTIFNRSIYSAPISVITALGVSAQLFLVLAISIAILRYRLFDIDLILNRTLVYGSLTALIVGTYAIVVGGLSEIFQTSGNLIISLLATGAIALLFHPLRNRLQRAVNRLTYGERDDPYAVLARLGQRLEATLAPDAILPTLAETVGQALKLPYAAIELAGPDGRADTAAVYTPIAAEFADSNVFRFGLLYQHESIGALVVAPRSGEETLSEADTRLLETIADQAAIAAYTVRLTRDLQSSRERLVTEREQERRRIRRDLHDGLGPALASMTLQLDAALNTLHQDPQTTAELLTDLKQQTKSSLADIRNLVYALRPPALDELGLLGAWRETITHIQSANGLEITLDAPAQMPPLSAAVEVAAYRIVMEAVNNVVQHAHATMCTVRIACATELKLEIVDNGVGMPGDVRQGVGWSSMRERAEELGGTFVVESNKGAGTRVVTTLPLLQES